MTYVASLRYGVIFKKAFGDVAVFTQFVKDFTGIQLVIDKVETEKSFDPPIGNVDSRFDLYAQDLENRVIVDIQHQHFSDHYHRFMHYHCAAILEQVSSAKNYSPALRVFTIVVLTSGNKHDSAIATVKFDPIDFLTQQPLGEIEHQVLYLTPKHVTASIPAPYHEWLQVIQDSLAEQVEETKYHNPMVLKILDLIQRDGLTPQDRARMKEEYGMEEVKQEEYKRGVTQGKTQGITEGIAQGERQMQLSLAKKLLQMGQLEIAEIAESTGLTVAEVKSL
jgi:predicted transposase/invertase (TIGR01784 family)